MLREQSQGMKPAEEGATHSVEQQQLLRQAEPFPTICIFS